MKHKFASLIALAAILSYTAPMMASDITPENPATSPLWLEADSAEAINRRILNDFSITYEEGVKDIMSRYPKVKAKDVRRFADNHYVETRIIDGVERMHRKSPSNLALLNPKMNNGWSHRGFNASPMRISVVDSVVEYYRGTNPKGLSRAVTYRYTIDVPYDPALKGDTLKAWLPIPRPTERQWGVEIISTYPEQHIVSTPDQSVHSTVFMQQPVVDGENTHFEVVARYVVNGVQYTPEYILANIKPYDKESELYKKYTSFEQPHIVNLDSLAHAIVGSETNPYRMSELVYDYIITNYPWAGAREYSTIECIPQYVIDERHGDCGQVALLYISMMRTLGVPAMWESGWMIHPGELNLHDWAKVYFEGVGWVPVDCSFGRYTTSYDPEIVKFYSTGIDSHRLTSNEGVCGEFYPPKQYLRSETVDSQVGEVESSKGNLFYPGWKRKMQILSNEPIASSVEYAKEISDKLSEIKKKYTPDQRQALFEYSIQPYLEESNSPLRGGITVSGVTTSPQAWQEFDEYLKSLPFYVENGIELLPDNDWAQVKLSVITMRTRGAHSAEGATQALMGMPVKLLQLKGEWWRAQTPDGYIAWIPVSSIEHKTPEQLAQWRKSPRLVVTAPYQTRAYSSEKATGLRDVVTDLVNGCIVEGKYNPKAKRLEITLPDGRKGWVDTKDVTPIETWANQEFNPQAILDLAYSMEGSPYLWGGTSIKNLDCSGLAKVSYLSNGIILMRDASQQALTGTRIEAKDWRTCQPGDLLFFGNARTGRVTHVAIYDHDGNYVHSSGRVKRNSVDPESPLYLTTPFLHAVRIHGNEGTPGITRAKDHPWYF